jgi:hypothetical protein
MLTPLVLGAVAFYFLREPLSFWRHGDTLYDEQAIKEWVREARVGDRSLPELLRTFKTDAKARAKALQADPASEAFLAGEHGQRRAEIYELLEALCLPPTKIYAGQLPLFPVIYRLEIRFDESLQKELAPLNLTPIAWDSDNPRHAARKPNAKSRKPNVRPWN